MSDMTECMKGSHNILDIFRTKKYLRNFAKDNPDYFKPEGIMIFSRISGSR